jgi:tryptophan-rich sensory protein
MQDERPLERSDPRAEPPLKRQAVALLVCLALPFAAAALGGYATSRAVDGWYQTLERPAWTPPGWLFGPVWTVLYTLMGLSAWLSWREVAAGRAAAAEAEPARRWFLGQLALNTAWSFAFFGLRSPLAGLAVIVPLWLSIVGWIRATHRVNPTAAWLQLPYLAWVSFASCLNAALWWLNRNG